MDTQASLRAAPSAGGSPKGAADLLGTALDAVQDITAVLSAHSTIVLTNISWRQYAMTYSTQSATDLLQKALDGVQDIAAVIDAHGTIVMTNIAWREKATACSPKSTQVAAASDVGANYLKVTARSDDPHGSAAQSLQGILDVLSGKIDAFSMVYPCHTPEERFWFTMTVVPLDWQGELGALVMHTDTTPHHHLDQR